MFQDNLGLVVTLVVAVVVISLILLTMVIAFKIQRDRRERRGRKYRDRLWQAWIDNNPQEMVKTCRMVAKGGHQVQSDFIQMSDRAVGADWWTDDRVENLHRAADDAGLTAALRKQLTSRSDVTRGLAVTIAGYPGTSLRPHELAPFLDDTEPTVRLAAAGSLERMADPLAAEVLITALIDERLPDERIIERLGHPWAVPSILEKLADPVKEVTSRVRCGLARALALAEDPRAMPAMEVMADEGDLEERVQALKALVACAPHGTEKQRSELEFFARHLMDDEHPVIRTQVAAILGAGGYESDIPMLTHMASDRDWFVRRAAARSLAQLGAPGLAALRRVAQSDDEFAAQRAREELTFATIMAARRSAETGEDFETLLGTVDRDDDIPEGGVNRTDSAPTGGRPSGGVAAAGVVATGLAAASEPQPQGSTQPEPPVATPQNTDGDRGRDAENAPHAAAVDRPARTDAAAQPAKTAGVVQRLTTSGPIASPATYVTAFAPSVVVARPAGQTPTPLTPAELPGPALRFQATPSAHPGSGEAVALTGRYRPKGREARKRARRARLQVRLGDRWKSVDSVALTKKGRFAFCLDDVGTVGAVYRYRVVITGEGKNDVLAEADPIEVTVTD